MEGGIIGRVDDMVIVRGVNVFPSGIDALLRGIDDVAEYQVEVWRDGALTEMKLRVEPADGARASGLDKKVAARMQDVLSLRCAVEVVPAGSLPRFELKARRWVRRTGDGP
jgi:phenylacetate-CoA ligase